MICKLKLCGDNSRQRGRQIKKDEVMWLVQHRQWHLWACEWHCLRSAWSSTSLMRWWSHAGGVQSSSHRAPSSFNRMLLQKQLTFRRFWIQQFHLSLIKISEDDNTSSSWREDGGFLAQEDEAWLVNQTWWRFVRKSVMVSVCAWVLTTLLSSGRTLTWSSGETLRCRQASAAQTVFLSFSNVTFFLVLLDHLWPYFGLHLTLPSACLT